MPRRWIDPPAGGSLVRGEQRDRGRPPAAGQREQVELGEGIAQVVAEPGKEGKSQPSGEIQAFETRKPGCSCAEARDDGHDVLQFTGFKALQSKGAGSSPA